MSDDEFWELTIEQLYALLKRLEFENEVADRRVARICMVMANCHRDPKKRAFREKDFMPKKAEKPKETNKDKKKQSADDLLLLLQRWNAATGGKEVVDGNKSR